jgi:hypothetical protein
MNEFDAFRHMELIRLHFTQVKFDATSTEHLSGLEARFQNLTEAEYRKIQSIANQYRDLRELSKSCVACHLDDKDIRWIDNGTSYELYLQYVGRMRAIRHNLDADNKTFQQALQKSNHPVLTLLSLVAAKKVTPEFAMVIEAKKKFLKSANYDTMLIGFKPLAFRLTKYKAFFNAEKFL